MTTAFLTDTHCHLNLNTFVDDLPAVIDRAVAQGVYRILVPGIDLPSSQLAVELADQYPLIYAAVGVHPSHASDWTDDTLARLEELSTHPKVLAIGEIGLDYYRDHSPRDHQQRVLTAQLDLAARRHLPVVLHNRESLHGFVEPSSWNGRRGFYRLNHPLPAVLESCILTTAMWLQRYRQYAPDFTLA